MAKLIKPNRTQTKNQNNNNNQMRESHTWLHISHERARLFIARTVWLRFYRHRLLICVFFSFSRIFNPILIRCVSDHFTIILPYEMQCDAYTRCKQCIEITLNAKFCIITQIKSKASEVTV